MRPNFKGFCRACSCASVADGTLDQPPGLVIDRRKLRGVIVQVGQQSLDLGNGVL